jgi:hypothetical protein
MDCGRWENFAVFPVLVVRGDLFLRHVIRISILMIAVDLAKARCGFMYVYLREGVICFENL